MIDLPKKEMHHKKAEKKTEAKSEKVH